MPVAVFMVVALLLAGLPGPAAGQSPESEDNRLTLLVPAGAGGGTDAIARRLALLLNEPLGMPVVVVNRPARGGLEALEALAAAEPDGQTLALVTGQAMQPLARPEQDVSAILLINLDPPALHVRRGDAPQEAVRASLAGAARASGGPSLSLWHLALAGLAHAEGGTLPSGAWQPVARATAALDRLERGEVRLVVAEAAQGAAGRRAGALEVVPDGPLVPRDVAGTLGGWRGLVGPPGMSKKLTEQIAVAARQIVGRDSFRHFLGLRGYTPANLGPDAFKGFLATFARQVARARDALP